MPNPKDKIKTLNQMAAICKRLRKQGKTIGLITGCFDIFHIGHLQLITFAKTKCNKLVVGIDNDKSVGLSKGTKRPIFTAKQRAYVMGGVADVNCVFIIPYVLRFGSEKSRAVHEKILKKINPHCVISSIKSDHLWKYRALQARKQNIKFIADTRKTVTTSTQIIKKLGL